MCIKIRFFGKGVKKRVVTKSLQRSETGFRKCRCIRWFWLRCPYDFELTQDEKPERSNTEN